MPVSVMLLQLFGAALLPFPFLPLWPWQCKGLDCLYFIPLRYAWPSPLALRSFPLRPGHGFERFISWLSHNLGPQSMSTFGGCSYKHGCLLGNKNNFDDLQ